MDMKRSKYQRVKNLTQTRYDFPLLLTLLALMLYSMITVFSTTYLQYEEASLLPTLMHGAWFLVGLVLVYLMMQLDRKTLFRLAPLAYFFGLFLLILVLIFYDRGLAQASGARSWFSIGGLTFQPSELMKLFYIIMMGRLVDDYTRDCNRIGYDEMAVRDQVGLDWRFLLKLFAWSLPPMLLVVLQNDFGTMLVFMMILVGIIFVSGISWHIILPTFLVITLLFLILLFLVVYDRDLLLNLGFQDYQFSRIDSWLAPFENTASESYQLSQSIKAVGSGKMFGKGLGNFEVYVPVRESDMIFSSIAENFGFIGSSLLILLYFILIYCMISAAFKTNDSFYVAMVAGIVTLFAFHIIENIGMTIGLLPLTGIPLPFISQGGSALITNMMCVGLVASIRYNERQTEKDHQQNLVIRLARKLTKEANLERFRFIRTEEV
ncbi:FtsW/RodA/SpoVE family cell cycle protein [Aerococcus sanguinicola]|uniref:FtsW/RodA/SpoVE family cell cycle protein n=1 Tax=unclassified Aerococcus TaxID=2618060 RepID=UPI000AB59761|nr:MULTISPECIES: FtsW/RodA/SpoVE family cell cycle protein [unclassified Aerococcus]MDK6234147.1 FtsW/RodA/SpoVE family cell cycle protein [Aerococcus sp. UMB10185]MDK6855426.1 FtsW/RodA/SpoVE family cell cycle protein [Aerococcus sp. UMB7533]MDK8501604.1 FtsW/RodA/SpoVE family cell cycle protein [Aerococcus sp. UMB1112A]